MDTWKMVDEERSALADDLATLDDSQWETQSLGCGSAQGTSRCLGDDIAGVERPVDPFLLA
jgi:hypothetical protein